MKNDEKWNQNGSQNEVVFKIRVVFGHPFLMKKRTPRKVSEMRSQRWPKGIPNGAIGGPPTLVDFEGPENRSISKAPRVAKKSMDVRLGAVRGQTGPTKARQQLGEGVRFEKGVPRAALVRARLINKVINS